MSMIRLEGGFELDEYWREVRQTGNDRLKEFGFEEWVVTLRPMTAADSENAGAHEEQAAVKLDAATRMLEIAVHEQSDLPPESFVQTGIIDAIEQATHTPRDDDIEDLLSDEGGEA